jgi:hypothetical protein
MRITTFDLAKRKLCGIEVPLTRLAASPEPLKAATWLKLLQLVEHLQSSDPELELSGIIILDHLVLQKPDLPDPVRELQIKRFVDEWRAQNADRPTWGDQLRREMQKRFPAKPKINVSVWVDWRDYSPLQDGLPEMHYRFKIECPGKTLTEDARAKGLAEAKRIICEAFEF